MSHHLEYQKCYHKRAHQSAINAMVLSPGGARLVTGSDDCTVKVWSTLTGDMLCIVKTHSPVTALAWITSENGFILGCANGIMATICFSEVWDT